MNYKPANKVRTAKILIIIMGVCCIVAATPFLLDGFGIAAALVCSGLFLFVCGGLIEGYAQIVETACELSWEFDQRQEQKKQQEESAKIDDADVQ